MATRIVDLGSVIGPQGPAGADGRRVARFVVGTSTAGWTADDCDYLCDGTNDEVEINAAIAALPNNGGEVVLLDGLYYTSEAITIEKSSVILRGSGSGSTTLRADKSDRVGALVLSGRDITLADMAIAAASGISRSMTVSGANVTVRSCAFSRTVITVTGAQFRLVNSEYAYGDSTARLTFQGEGSIIMGNFFYAGSLTGVSIAGSNSVVVGNVAENITFTGASGDATIVVANNAFVEL